MPPNDTGDRTEQPTERRRTEARNKGNVARSVDLSAAAVMLAVALVMAFLIPNLILATGQLLHASFDQPAWLTMNISKAQLQSQVIRQYLTDHVLPMILFIMLMALIINFAQVGFLLSFHAVQPQWSRMSPLKGIQRIVSLTSLFKLMVNLAKLSLLVGVAIWWTASMLPELKLLVYAEPTGIAYGIASAVSELALALAIVLLILGIADFAYQKWKHEQDLKMTKQEVRDEMKQMEGDPLIRQRRRQIHRQLVDAKELQQVQHADVVITNPTHISIAIRYDEATMDAPTVIAKGQDEKATRIRQLAAEHHVPIIERKELARQLYREVKVGQPVPIELYEVFAEIMAYVYRLSGKAPQAA